MNINPDATTFLCFGDSNTWGQKSDKSGRHPADVRWTGQLQKLLGDNYYIIEEGLSSRTTDLDYKRPGRNGKTYLIPCLVSHNPLDVVLIMLGTNDLKIEFGRSAVDIANALKGLVEIVREYGKDKNGGAPKVILVSPILADDTAPRFSEFYADTYDSSSTVISAQIASAIQEVAQQTNCHFVDASTVAQPGEDGLHLSEESHPALAELLAKELTSL